MDNAQKPESKEKMGLISWIKNYGYYYKGWIWVAIFAILLVFAMIFLFHYEGADMRLYTFTETPIDQEAFAGFYQHLSDDYLYDVDGDKTALIRPFQYVMKDRVKGSLDPAGLPEELAKSECLGFIVDDAGYEQLKTLCQLRELSFFGVEADADDPYRLTLTGTALFDTGNIPDGVKYYLVMKYIDNTEYNNAYTSGYTDIFVGMARNNDGSEENNVVISKK